MKAHAVDTTRRGRPADPAKRTAILETALRLFLKHGYGVGLDVIAAEAGVSRQTIYNLFSSKDDLFAAIVQESSNQITEALAELAPDAQPRQVLSTLGESFLAKITSERTVAFQRLLASSTANFPTLGPTFYANGPGRGIARLAAYLDRETVAGRLAITDPVLAAEQFFGMLVGHRAMRRLLRMDGEMPQAEIKRRVESAVTAFLRAYTAEE
ncbi:MAG TPA: TetR/AcrR family transcriptional regulator [Ferrovibrio sp.]|uniref:TetR/AcrR family transcriptional regulator n=1 Tax=Ferrovibrio sp. TaxID=1917215 RepID=UPI002ED2EF1B